jgi:hypothetical protein
MAYTHHAQHRCKQRGIPIEVANIIFSVGDEYPAKGKGCKVFLVASQEVKKELESEIKAIGLSLKEGWTNAYLIIGPGQEIITAGYRHKRFKRTLTR